MPDRDLSVERWLRKTPLAGARAESAQCLDAETLAAWSEGLLAGSQRASAEAHAAGCARCQAMLAVMVRTMPQPAMPAASPLRKWLMMLSPALAAAAAVALWFAVDPRPAPTPGMFETASRQEGAAAVPSAVSPASPAPASSALDLKPDGKDAQAKTAPVDSVESKTVLDAAKERLDAGRSREARASTDKTAAVPRNEADARKSEAAVRDEALLGRRAAVASPPAASPAPPPPPAPAKPAAMVETVTVTAEAPPVAVANSSAVNQANQANQANQQNQGNQTSQVNQTGQLNQVNQVAQAEPRQQAGPPAEPAAGGERAAANALGGLTSSRAGAGRGGAVAGFADAFGKDAGTFEVVAPDASSRWRIVAGRTVQRSLDTGRTWTNQYTPEDGVTLTAGVAPSSPVCWLVGRAGAVLLTTDGRNWQRLKFPESVDLTTVTATDARSASVTAGNGRTFLTTDGGRNWTPR